MKRVEKFTTGPPELVDKFNAMVDAINQMQNTIGDGIIKVQKSQSGVTIGLDINQVRKRMAKSSGSGSAGKVRRAITTQAAPGSSTITANLYNSRGIEQTEGDESGITVYCSIVGGSALNVSSTNLADNTVIFVAKFPYDNDGTPENRWFLVGLFQTIDTDQLQFSGTGKLQTKLDIC